MICFHCNEMGHKKEDYPRLLGGVVMEPAPATLMITDGHQGKAQARMVRSRAFHLTAEEAQAAPDVFTGMYLYHVFFMISLFMLMFYLTVYWDVFSQWFDC